MVEYNLGLVNLNNPGASFFHLSKSDPTQGFQYDATTLGGQAYSTSKDAVNDENVKHLPEDAILSQRLILGSQLLLHIRTQIEQVKGFTCTGGVSTNKLLSKLVGNVHKPRDQTTLMPPYQHRDGDVKSNVTSFIDTHEIGKIPGIGFKMALKLRSYFHQRHVPVKDLIMTVSDKDLVDVGAFRNLPGLDEAVLERILGGSGAPKGIGSVVWNLLHGRDEREVAAARQVPKQISIEDSYLRLDTLDNAIKQMIKLSTSLIGRMRMDLTGLPDQGEHDSEDVDEDAAPATERVWIAQPKTLRLSTRPRAPVGADGVRPRTFNRISRSRVMPGFMMSMTITVPELAEKLTAECLLPMFRQIHPQREGWNLSLINVAVTEIAEMASDTKMAVGRDISKMFRNQNAVLGPFRVQHDGDMTGTVLTNYDAVVLEQADNYKADAAAGSDWSTYALGGSEDMVPFSQQSRWSEQGDDWDMEESLDHGQYQCQLCGARMPDFAITAHDRFHDAGE